MNDLNWKNGNIFEKVKKLREDVKDKQKKLNVDVHNSSLKEDMVKTLNEYNEATSDEENILSQKAKIECAIREFFSNGKMLGEISATVISLVQKLSTPSKVSYFRSIPCCNVIYKCLSKVLTNKIKDALKKLVNENHSTFMPGRHIQDNIMLSQELLKGLNQKLGAKRVALKIDIQKAYDIIMKCVTNAQYSINVNGENHGYFKGGRDDLLVFCNGDAQSVKVLKWALDELSKTSCLLPNPNKSTIFFGSCKENDKADILAIMPFGVGKLPVKNLGVPLVTRSLKAKQCKSLVDKVVKRGKLTKGTTVSKMINNGNWNWPKDWNDKFQVVINMNVPRITEGVKEKLLGKTQKERNARLFRNEKRICDCLIGIIEDQIRIRLMSLVVKSSQAIKEVENM
ncbi:RNA-directed DNA polymerase, eukaryota, reverse transcriptase zinc-binding domain protein [Tanacetum coccineum]